MYRDPDPPFWPSELGMAIALLVALLLACLWSFWVPAVHGAPAPFPRQEDPRVLEQARAALVGSWAMSWSGNQPCYEAEFAADGRYSASSGRAVYTGTWTVCRAGDRIILVIRERLAWQIDQQAILDPGPHSVYRFVLDQKDPRRGRHEAGGAWSLRLYPGWDQEPEVVLP